MARQKKEPNRLDELLDELLEDCHSPEDILGEAGLMKQIKKRLVERALAGELNGHLKSSASDEEAAPNSRNGRSKKTVTCEDGELELSIPRDRNGSFEPILVPKHQRRIAGLDEKILALYARGNSTRDISAQLEELYGGAKISAAVISEVIESVSEDVKAWQSRPLDEARKLNSSDARGLTVSRSSISFKKAFLRHYLRHSFAGYQKA